MATGQQGGRSLVGVAFEAYEKAFKAQQRANAAAAEAKRWSKNLNAAEREEFDAQVSEFEEAQQGK